LPHLINVVFVLIFPLQIRLQANNKVFLSRGNVPADSYTFFVDKLMATIRDEIASCCEKVIYCHLCIACLCFLRGVCASLALRRTPRSIPWRTPGLDGAIRFPALDFPAWRAADRCLISP